MNKERIVAALNEDLSGELGAIMQYLWHHFTGEGPESPYLLDLFKKTALDEMRHLALIAERIVYLGGEPTTTVMPFAKGGDLRRMVEDDLKGEEEAIARYRDHIRLAAEEGDHATRLMLEQILADEEGHADRWETFLGRRGG